MGLTNEKMAGKKFQELTEVGKIIYENDPYNEELGTLALLHYFLATSKESATSWYFSSMYLEMWSLQKMTL